MRGILSPGANAMFAPGPVWQMSQVMRRDLSGRWSRDERERERARAREREGTKDDDGVEVETRESQGPGTEGARGSEEAVYTQRRTTQSQTENKPT